MKPREFDDLIRQKFDEGVFEYKAQNWDRLADELDGREKKKRGLLVWWMPVISMAASVAFAMGVPLVLRESGSINSRNTMLLAQLASPAPEASVAALQPGDAENGRTALYAATAKDISSDKNNTGAVRRPGSKSRQEAQYGGSDDVALAVPERAIDEIFTQPVSNAQSFRSSKKSSPANSVMSTFADESAPVAAKKSKRSNVKTFSFYTYDENIIRSNTGRTAFSVSGGVNYSGQSNGYTLGASARRMVNDKVYVEGDVAFVGITATGRYTDMVYVDNSDATASTLSKAAPAGTTAGSAGGAGGSGSSAMSMPASQGSGRVAARGGNFDAKSTVETPDREGDASIPRSYLRTTEKTYNSYYAQFTPTVGYKIMKRISVGVGPDFQQMIGDNRPEVSATATGNIQRAPTFDVGFMGKTEYAVSKNVKAAIYYREGVNNVVTPMNRFIDRNYLQIQLKCNILNR